MNDEKIFENNIVDALLNAAAFRTEENLREIVIKRDERELFRFKIHGLDEDTLNRCRKSATKNRGRRDEEVDWSRYSAQVIYEATVDDDKKTLWQNREVWQKLDAVTGSDVIYKVLMPAERAKIIEAIESLSGYDGDLDLQIKNA